MSNNLFYQKFINNLLARPHALDTMTQSIEILTLSTLLQRKIGRVNVAVQKVIPPADTGLKGIRLDVKVEELEYEDGLQFYYFYTGGSKGGNDEILLGEDGEVSDELRKRILSEKDMET